MRSSTIAPLAFAAMVAASPMPQSAGSPPDGCSSSYDGVFQIQVVNVTTSSKRSLGKRAVLELTLADGILKDAEDRTGYIAGNHQFQFDAPPQENSIYTSGWSVCSNGSLAIGGEAIFYQCLSGDFYNLYDETTGAQCSQVYIDVIGGAASGVAPTSAVVSVQSDGQPTGAAGATSAAAVTQIGDGQIQASTSASAVTQISDGQIQAPTSATPVAPVTQIGDGQIQAPTSAVAPVTQIGDGQIQAPTATAVAPVTQIGDGQIQAPATGTGYVGNSTAPTAAPSPYTGAAGAVQASVGLGFGALLMAMLL